MDVTVKTEDGQGESITEAGNASVRDGDVGSGSLKDRGKKTVSPSDGETKTETKTDWNEENFVLTIDYFAIECNLPNDGQLPGDIPKSLVSDEEFEMCFGPSTGFNGRNGSNIKNCVGLPQHRNQIRSHKQRGEESSGPPIVRPHRVYKPPPNLILELASYDEPAISKKPAISKELKPKVQPAASVSGEQEEAPSVKHATKVEVPKSGVKSETRPITYMPGVLELKANIRDREKLIAKLQDDITAQSDAIDSINDKLKIVAESISNAKAQFKTDNAERAKLETERSTLDARKQTLEMRLEDGGFNEDDPGDMKLLNSLESEEEDLNLSYSRVLTAIEECTSKLVQSQTELKLSRSKEGGLNAEITAAEFEIQKLQSSLTKAESIVEAQIGELKHVEPFAEASIATLSPRLEPNVLGGCPLLPPKLGGASPCSTILSSREDDRDNDAILVATNHVPVTRSKKGKRGGSKADVPARKVRTRSLKSRKSSRFNVHQHSTCSVVSPGVSYYATLIMCLHVVSDGRGRKTREIAGWSQSGVLECTAFSQMSTPAGKSRDRAGHTCAESSVHMFHFFVETGEPSNHVLEVWDIDRAGQELFKMTVQEFFDKYGSDVESLRKFVSGYLASTRWAVTVIGNSSVGAFLRVLSFSCAGVSLPKKESMLVSAPSPHVGVVHIPAVPDRAESAVQISSSHGRSS
ncbi:hypothetical protein R1sor_024142 [Riccia sorocarpa]|uniref:Uncharacterized protein n=1 Tax=Riccia sorocarpa TaxID=122646 RepID=A0ABD3GR68_9MARC